MCTYIYILQGGDPKCYICWFIDPSNHYHYAMVNLVLFTNCKILNWGTTLYKWANPRGMLKHGDTTSYFTVVNAIVILTLSLLTILGSFNVDLPGKEWDLIGIWHGVEWVLTRWWPPRINRSNTKPEFRLVFDSRNGLRYLIWQTLVDILACQINQKRSIGYRCQAI